MRRCDWHTVRDLPPPRVDALDHVVADTDAEMARITASVAQTFDAAARRHGDVKVETVVRFGSPAREAAVEAEVYAPQIIVVYAAATGLVARLRGWALRQQLLRRPDARLLVLYAAPAREIRRPRVGVRPPGLLPAHRD